MTKTMKTHKLILQLCLLSFCLVVVACSPSTPIAIYVTATFIPDTTTPTIETSITEIPATETPIPTVEVLPTETPLPLPTNTISPNVTIRGPIGGEHYTLPATQTPIPTDTPAPGVTLTSAETSVPVPANLPTLNPIDIGIQLDINLSQDDWNYSMGRIEQLGIHWVKVQLSWRDMQPNGRDDRDNEFFRRVEQYLEDASRRGLDVMISIAKAPTWARSNQTEDGPPDNPADLANFLTVLFEEVNPGLARDMIGEYIDAVEIWNEPNLIREWQGTLPFSGAGYMQLFAPAYQAIRAYSSTIPIITAGLAPTANTAGSIEDREYLRQMYAAGLANYADVVIGAHPYGWGNPPDATCCGSNGWDEVPQFYFGDTMRQYHEIMLSNGHNVEIWITEFGYATWDGFPGDPPPDSAWMRFNDRWAQGGYTIRALQIAEEMGYVGPVFLWNLNFATLTGLIENRDERVAYSIIIPGSGCNVSVGSSERTERPLFWMLFDAVHPEENLADYCGVPPNPIPGLSQ